MWKSPNIKIVVWWYQGKAELDIKTGCARAFPAMSLVPRAVARASLKRHMNFSLGLP